jgi:hypothetical protein
MGRQVNFYMNNHDQKKVYETILSVQSDCILLNDEMKSQKLEFLDPNDPIGYYGKYGMILIARKADIEKILIDPPRQVIVPPFNIRHLINRDDSPVIEFSRCCISHNDNGRNIIQRGRLYYRAEYYINNFTAKVQHSPEFIKFAQKQFSLFKKSLILNKEDGLYYGEGALADQKNGWQLI